MKLLFLLMLLGVFLFNFLLARNEFAQQTATLACVNLLRVALVKHYLIIWAIHLPAVPGHGRAIFTEAP
jgi:hypothetical protein